MQAAWSFYFYVAGGGGGEIYEITVLKPQQKATVINKIGWGYTDLIQKNKAPSECAQRPQGAENPVEKSAALVQNLPNLSLNITGSNFPEKKAIFANNKTDYGF